METFAPRKLRRSSAALIFAAGVLACVLALPTPSEAHRFNGNQPTISKDCIAQRPDRVVIRGVWPCFHSKHIAARPMLPERKAKARKGLIPELYCRISSTDISELTHKSDAVLPCSSPQRLMDAAGEVPLEWASSTLRPDLDTQEIEGVLVGRLPDG